ncbi:VOC family protein [Corynebacterium nasicanis]|uniref:VOC family protein n=1 Tax=Corynebacterium nasicanis TaxID=1448267 RepID=A0ABW1QEA3_9CORY
MTINHGDPVWMDLSTDDIEAAATFYRELLGWEFQDQGEEFGGYRIITRDGKPVGGAMSSLMGPDGPTEEPQYPTAWTVYLKVDDLDAALEATTAHGGTVVVPAMEVGELGRMAVIFDPAGAGLGLWEVGSFEGFVRDNGPGFPAWFESMTRDFDAAEAFYREVAGWQIGYIGEDGQPADGPSGDIRYGATSAAGLCEADSFLPPGVPSYWRAYVVVEDVDASVEKLRELGGTVLDGPVDTPFGRIATVADPQGGSFQISS